MAGTMPKEQMTEISVVIPTREKGGPILEPLLESLLKQTLRKELYEILIVGDNGAEKIHPTVEKYLRHNNIYFYSIDHIRAGPKRNHGVKKSKHEIVLFLDDDMTASENLLEEHLKYHNKYDGNILGFFNNALKTPKTQKRIDHALLEYIDETEDQNLFEGESGSKLDFRFFYTGNISVRKKNFNKIGGFDPGFKYYGVEDIDIGYKFYIENIPIYLNREAKTTHRYEPSYSQYLAKKFEAGYSLGYFIHKYKHLYRAFTIKKTSVFTLTIKKLLYTIPAVFSKKFLFKYIYASLKLNAALGYFKYFREALRPVYLTEASYLR